MKKMTMNTGVNAKQKANVLMISTTVCNLFILVASVKYWSAMLMLSKDCGTQRKIERERQRETEREREIK